MNRLKFVQILVVTGACLAVPQVSRADYKNMDYEVSAILSGQDGFFNFSLFHTSESLGGIGGTDIGWIALNPSGTNTYNPVTGALSLDISVYSDPGFNTLVATGKATSTNLAGSNFTVDPTDGFPNGTNDVLGNITWDVDKVGSGGDFWAWLETSGVTSPGSTEASFTQTFVDHLYASGALLFTGTPDVTPPNSLLSYNDGTYDHPLQLTLWGTEGTQLNRFPWLFDTCTTTVGTDIVLVFGPANIHSPTPGGLTLIVSGAAFALLGGMARRRRNRNQSA